MKMKTLWLSWLYLFALCAVLGFIPEPDGLIKALLILAAVSFFVPGFWLAVKGGKKCAKWIILISALSLVLTMVLIILNYASVLLSAVWGTVFNILLTIFSTPMFCGQYWVISLFCWASLLFTALTMVRKT